MNRVRWIGIIFCSLLATRAHAQTQLQTDEQTLRAYKMPTDAKGLLHFFESAALKEGDAKLLETAVRHLDSSTYAVRESATKSLIKRGPAALPFLRAVLVTSSVEMKIRAENCIRAIEATLQSDSVAAAARVLTLSNEPTAAAAMLDFLPAVSSDPFAEEEVLACLGRLTIKPGKVAPLILQGIHDPLTYRRMAAAYVLGRRGSVEYRASLRELLTDADLQVRQRVADGLVGKRSAQMLHEAFKSDEALLRSLKIDPAEPTLLAYFRKRTLNETDQQRYRTLVRNMGSSSFSIREQANKQLLKEGTPVLAFLKEAELDPNAELARRAQRCIDDIRTTHNPAVPIAAAHLLARPPLKKDASAAEQVRTLLAYIPFVDDAESVEEETLTCLTLLRSAEAGCSCPS